MKVTVRRLKLRALWETFRNAPAILVLVYQNFLIGLLEAKANNPRIKW